MSGIPYICTHCYSSILIQFILCILQEAVHCVSCCPEAPYIFSFGMDKELRVFDIRDAATGRVLILTHVFAKIFLEYFGI